MNRNLPPIEQSRVWFEQMTRMVASTPISVLIWVILAGVMTNLLAEHFSNFALLSWWLVFVFALCIRALPWIFKKSGTAPDRVNSNLAAWSISVSATALGVLLCILPLLVWGSLPMTVHAELRTFSVGLLVTGALALVTLPRASLMWVLCVGVTVGVGPYVVEPRASAWTLPFMAILVVFLLMTVRSIGNNFKALYHANTEADRQRSMVELLLHDFQEEAREWLWETDVNGRVVYASPRAAEAVGQPIEKMLNMSLVDMLAPMTNGSEIEDTKQNEMQHDSLSRLLQRSTPFRNQIIEFSKVSPTRWFSLSAKPLVDASGKITGWRGTGIDVTSEFTRQREMERLATVDPLTGLANRLRLNQELDRHFPALAPVLPCALLLLDLDDFKDVNDRHGHPTGDRLLQQLAVRLTQQLRAGQVLARLGGDEFALVVPGDFPRVRLAEMGERMLTTLAAPYVVDDIPLVVRCSIGIAIGGVDAADAKSLLKSADLALYAAKAAGRNAVRFYGHDMHRKLENRFTLTEEMRLALTNGEFTLLYQPFVAPQTGKVTGFEALLRWNHPTRGLLKPEQFVPIAEETSIIASIGAWVFRQACADALHWPLALRVAVNVSAVQFAAVNVCDAIDNALIESTLPAGRLEVEITESTLFSDSIAARRTMISLREKGVLISLDDFGTGHASLNHMRSFPVTRLKIDRAFVTAIADTTREGNEARAIVRAAIDLSRAMEMNATAEGVETLDQLQVLERMYCEEVQGFFISYPMTVEEIPAYLARNALESEAQLRNAERPALLPSAHR